MSKESNAQKEAPKMVFYLKCPQCGKKYALNERYCNCGSELGSGVFQGEDERTFLEAPINLKIKNVNCLKCRGGCEYCNAFSLLKMNRNRMGSRYCQEKTDCLRCNCCQGLIAKMSEFMLKEQIEKGFDLLEIKEDVSRIIEKEIFNVVYELNKEREDVRESA